LEGFYELPDPDDEHVVTAAAKGGAEVIVTSNLKDFPDTKQPEPIRVLSPQQFAYDTVRQHVTPACRAVISICRRSGRKRTVLRADDGLGVLRNRYGMVDAVGVLSSAPGLLCFLVCSAAPGSTGTVVRALDSEPVSAGGRNDSG